MLHNISCIAYRHTYIYSTPLWLKVFHPQNREYFADVCIFISHSIKKLGQGLPRITSRLPLQEPPTHNTRENTTDPVSDLIQTPVQACRHPGGHCRAEADQSYRGLLRTLTNQTVEGLLQMICPWTWLLLWELSLLQLTQQKDKGHTKPAAQSSVPTGVQGTEQTTLQAMKLLAQYSCVQRTTKVIQNRKPHKRVMRNTFTRCHIIITILPVTLWSCGSLPWENCQRFIISHNLVPYWID